MFTPSSRVLTWGIGPLRQCTLRSHTGNTQHELDPVFWQELPSVALNLVEYGLSRRRESDSRDPLQLTLYETRIARVPLLGVSTHSPERPAEVPS